MPNVVRFALATSETRSVPGVGTFIGGYLDIDANNVEAVLRARFRLYAYQAVEVGIVDSEAPKAPLPVVPGPAAPDPYGQYVLDTDLTNPASAPMVALRAAFGPRAQTAQAQQWTTSMNRTSRVLTPSTPPPFAPVSAVTPGDVVVYPGETHQQILGLGAALTDASAYNLLTHLDATQRADLLREIYSPTQGNLRTVRIGVGATDFSSVPPFTYDDMPTGQTDPDLVNFSIAKDGARVIPVLRDILAINPAVRVFASAWYAPAWMLNTPANAYTGAQDFNFTTHTTTWASYLVKAIQAYAAYGIPIYAISVANEPLSGVFRVGTVQQQGMIKALGAALQDAGLDTRILAHDDQWVQYANLQVVLGDAATANYCHGVAWHGYDGSPRVSHGTIRRGWPNLTHHLTEYRSLQTETDAGIMGEMVGGYVIEGLRTGANSVTMWNLALDQNGNPTNGSPGRNGVLAISNTGTGAVTRNIEYYALMHVSRFVKPGAVRIGSLSHGSQYIQRFYDTPADQLPAEVRSVAFRNPDGSIVLVCYNGDTAARSFQVHESGRAFPVTLAGKDVATFVWGTSDYNAPASTATPPAATGATGFAATGGNGEVALSWSAPTTGAAVGSYTLLHGATAGTETTLITLPAGTTTYRDYVSAGAYSYRLATNTASGTVTTNSTPATATAPQVPGAPTLAATPTGTSITLTITPGATNGSPITGYSVRRGTTPGSTTAYATVAKGYTTFVDTSISSGQTYYYTVTATNATGTSADSNEVNAVIHSITVDAVATSATNATNATSLTYTHTTSAGLTKPILIVAAAASPTTGGTFVPRVSGVTYGGQALTRLAGPVDAYATDGTNRVSELWYLINPPAGAGSVVVTTTSTADITVGSLSLSGVNQTTPFRTPATAAFGGPGGGGGTATATPSVVTTGGAAGDMVLAMGALRSTSGAAPVAQTVRFSLANGRSTNAWLIGSTQPGGTGSITSAFTLSSGSNSSLIAVALQQ